MCGIEGGWKEGMEGGGGCVKGEVKGQAGKERETHHNPESPRWRSSHSH